MTTCATVPRAGVRRAYSRASVPARHRRWVTLCHPAPPFDRAPVCQPTAPAPCATAAKGHTP